jgi:hypothetical protein
MALDRTALIGRASSWVNWIVQVALYGTGAVLCWRYLDGVAGNLIALVVLLSLAEGAARLSRRTGNA